MNFYRKFAMSKIGSNVICFALLVSFISISDAKAESHNRDSNHVCTADNPNRQLVDRDSIPAYIRGAEHFIHRTIIGNISENVSFLYYQHLGCVKAGRHVEGGNPYIAVDVDYAKKLILENGLVWSYVLVLFHEFAHIVYGDNQLNRTKEQIREQELRADYFAGSHAARLCINYQDTQDYFVHLPPVQDDSPYPNKSERLAVFRAGYYGRHIADPADLVDAIERSEVERAQSGDARMRFLMGCNLAARHNQYDILQRQRNQYQALMIEVRNIAASLSHTPGEREKIRRISSDLIAISNELCRHCSQVR